MKCLGKSIIICALFSISACIMMQAESCPAAGSIPDSNRGGAEFSFLERVKAEDPNQQPGLSPDLPLFECISGFGDYMLEHFSLSGDMFVFQSASQHGRLHQVSSRLDGHVKLKYNFEWCNGEVSLRAEKNWKIPNMSALRLHEAWLEHSGDGWDIRIGRQIIVWGKADGLRITDNISPLDQRDYVVRSLEDSRMPVNAARFRLLDDTMITELIWLPGFRSSYTPSGSNPWNLAGENQYFQDGTDKPSYFSLKDSEYALRFSTYASGFDVSASIFYTWDDDAAHTYGIMNDGKHGFRPVRSSRYHRMAVYGLDFSFPWNDFVFRGETALLQNKYINTHTLGAPRRSEVLKSLVGMDWRPGGDWMVTTQISDNWINKWTPLMSSRRHSPMLTLDIAREMFNQTFKVSDMVYLDLNYGDYFNRLYGEYSVNDNMKVAVGWDRFGGGGHTYGLYKKNSELWMRIKFSF